MCELSGREAEGGRGEKKNKQARETPLGLTISLSLPWFCFQNGKVGTKRGEEKGVLKVEQNNKEKIMQRRLESKKRGEERKSKPDH